MLLVDSGILAEDVGLSAAKREQLARVAGRDRDSLRTDSNLLAAVETSLIWIKQCYSSPELNSARILFWRQDWVGEVKSKVLEMAEK